ncbi:MAG TPA: hypothetical protein PKH10_06565, partial [bacterium]|nr:hypothetical protein [bacterium]
MKRFIIIGVAALLVLTACAGTKTGDDPAPENDENATDTTVNDTTVTDTAATDTAVPDDTVTDETTTDSDVV